MRVEMMDADDVKVFIKTVSVDLLDQTSQVFENESRIPGQNVVHSDQNILSKKFNFKDIRRIFRS